MIYLKLFLIFLEIGAVSFGGGYAMISIVIEKCVSNNWLTEEEVMNFIAVSESTPGPIAINMATFVGSSQGGFLGALLATIGVVLPAFIIVLLIASVIKNLIKYKSVQGVLMGVQPIIVGIITTTAIIMFLDIILGITTVSNGVNISYKGLIIFGIITFIAIGYKLIVKKHISPILLIIVSAVLGILLYAF